MGRRKKNLMEENHNKVLDVEKLTPSGTTTTTCSTSTRANLFLYHIILGDDENDYYTWEQPIIKDSVVILNKLIQKGVLSEDIYEKEVQIFFRIDLPMGECDKITDLSSGIIIKTVNHHELNWLNKDLKLAQEEFKEESIKAYRELLPSLIKRVQQLENKKTGNNNLYEIN